VLLNPAAKFSERLLSGRGKLHSRARNFRAHARQTIK